MILYSYDENGLYVGPIAPALSPARPLLDDGSPNYLRPSRTTDIPPPSPVEGKAHVFDGTAWVEHEDHRGEVRFNADGQRVIVSTLGPIPAGYAADPRPSACHVLLGGVWTLDMGRAESAMRAERNRRLSACDWTQLPDSPLTSEQRASWANYRQSLRDYPSGWTLDKHWPASPTEE